MRSAVADLPLDGRARSCRAVAPCAAEPTWSRLSELCEPLELILLAARVHAHLPVVDFLCKCTPMVSDASTSKVDALSIKWSRPLPFGIITALAGWPCNLASCARRFVFLISLGRRCLKSATRQANYAN